ncbi:hypothetical protein Lp90_0765 [Lactiplantibacillus plantarum]|uniref:hypothetical protein n=1 Tax=Lactiplantibacillus plantarum TaxID=1590 RepID=UPI0004DD73AF|nr:hypothetical protein [Lactiplantibacillus plantarum]KEZ15325.1 hypothetical protein Lp90_0765 [Lactiplantibacillus plantarum]
MNLKFFNVFITKNGKKTNLSINQLLDYISNRTSLERTIKLADKSYYSMPQFEAVDRGHRIFWIGKFLKDKPYNGHLGTDDIEEIVGDVYQPVICSYESNYNLLIVQSSLIGPSKNKIQEFLNAYISEVDDGNTEEYALEIIPQYSELNIQNINQNYEIISITIEVRTNNYNENSFWNEHQHIFGALLQSGTDFGQQHDSKIMRLTFKNGHYKGDVNGTVIPIMQAINADDPSLINGNVYVKMPDGSKRTILLKGSKDSSMFKDVGDITGFGALKEVLKGMYTDNEIPSEAKFYNLNKYVDDLIQCNDHIDYKENPYGGLEKNEVEHM